MITAYSEAYGVSVQFSFNLRYYELAGWQVWHRFWELDGHFF